MTAPYTAKTSLNSGLIGSIPWLVLLTLSYTHCVHAQATTFFLGNSLTQDAFPHLTIDGERAIYCGQSLDMLLDGDPTNTCVTDSEQWNIALANNTYENVVVQLWTGDTVESSIEDISMLMDLQPEAKFFIYTGWAPHANILEDYASGGVAVHSPEFFAAVQAGLPERTQLIDVMSLLVKVANDPNSPYESIASIFRDFTHVNSEGHYLLHNVVRWFLGQEKRELELWDSAGTIEGEYLNSLLDSADYDFDSDTDGADFLNWQRNNITAIGLSDWGSNFGSVGSLSTVAYSVPEPSGLLLCFLTGIGLSVGRWRGKAATQLS